MRNIGQGAACRRRLSHFGAVRPTQPVVIMAAALVLSSVLQADADTLEARLAPCLACHGEKGQSVIPEVPSLGGQPVFYLTVQLLMFREKLRVRDLAYFLARLP